MIELFEYLLFLGYLYKPIYYFIRTMNLFYSQIPIINIVIKFKHFHSIYAVLNLKEIL